MIYLHVHAHIHLQVHVDVHVLVPIHCACSCSMVCGKSAMAISHIRLGTSVHFLGPVSAHACLHI